MTDRAHVRYLNPHALVGTPPAFKRREKFLLQRALRLPLNRRQGWPGLLRLAKAANLFDSRSRLDWAAVQRLAANVGVA